MTAEGSQQEPVSENEAVVGDLSKQSFSSEDVRELGVFERSVADASKRDVEYGARVRQELLKNLPEHVQSFVADGGTYEEARTLLTSGRDMPGVSRTIVFQNEEKIGEDNSEPAAVFVVTDSIDKGTALRFKEKLDERIYAEASDEGIEKIEKQLRQDGIANKKNSFLELSKEGRAVGYGLLKEFAERFREESQVNVSKKERKSIAQKFKTEYKKLRKELEDVYGLTDLENVHASPKLENVTVSETSGSRFVEKVPETHKVDVEEDPAQLDRLRRKLSDAEKNIADIRKALKLGEDLIKELDGLSRNDAVERLKYLSEKANRNVTVSSIKDGIEINKLRLKGAKDRKKNLEEEIKKMRESAVRTGVAETQKSRRSKGSKVTVLARGKAEGDDAELRDVTGSLYALWGDLSPEERKERMKEMREKLTELKNARANLIALESMSSFKRYFRGGAKREELKEARERYEQLRAEYVGEKASRVLADKTRMAHEQAKQHLEGKTELFAKLRKGWRWLGDKNVGSWIESKGYGPKNKLARFALKMISVRTAVSLGLLGGGIAAGAGLLGIAAVSARRVLSGAGTAFGSYDLIRMVSEKQRLNFNDEEIEKMDASQLEDVMARFETTAKFSGKQIVRNPVYTKARARYLGMMKLSVSLTDGDGMSQALQRLDSILREQEHKVTRSERKSKVVAVGIGALFSTVGPALCGRLLAGEFGNEAKETAEQFGKIGEEVADAVKEETKKVPSIVVESGEGASEMVGSITDKTAGVAASGAVEAVEASAASGDIIETIGHGGSVFSTLERMVESGQIESMEKALSALKSSDSVLVTETGEIQHVALATRHLVHADDQLVFVPEADGVEAHFELRDFAGDDLHIGSAEDLKQAFITEGRDIPQWLEGASDAERELADVAEAVGSSADEVMGYDGPDYIGLVETFERIGRPVPDWMQDAADAQQAVAEGDLPPPEPEAIEMEDIPPEVLEQVMTDEEVSYAASEGSLGEMPETIPVAGGDAHVITGEDGKVANIYFTESFSTGRSGLAETAKQYYLDPLYGSHIDSASFSESGSAQVYAAAEKTALDLYRFNQVREQFPGLRYPATWYMNRAAGHFHLYYNGLRDGGHFFRGYPYNY